MAWLKQHGTFKQGFQDVHIQCADFLSTSWHLWKARNALVFSDSSLQPHGVALQASSYSKCTIEGLVSGFLNSSSSCGALHSLVTSSARILQAQHRWFFSPLDTGIATVGGLVRDHLGGWVREFSLNIGSTTSQQTEL